MQFKHCTLELDGPVAILRLDHQEVMNAVSMDMLGGLSEALDAIEDKKDEVRCVVLTGAGRAFCTGANLQGRNTAEAGPQQCGVGAGDRLPSVPAARAQPALSAGNRGQRAGRRRRHELRAARRHDPGRALGVFPASLPPHRPRAGLRLDLALPRLVGKARSIELSLMGDRLPAEKALEWGLINRVHDDAELMKEAMKLAHELANGPTVALSLIRQLYWDSPENSFEDQLNLEFRSQRLAGATEDFKEGVTAFLEKRPAKFKGK